MELKESIAELLESLGQWRRAVRRWHAVMDSMTNDAKRKTIARRRENCIDMGADISPDG